MGSLHDQIPDAEPSFAIRNFRIAAGMEHDLPNDTVYAETCASIGLIFFARRMLQLEEKSEYADVMERALYNCSSAVKRDSS